MVGFESWAEYMRRVTDGATQVQIAERTGIEQSSISRWRQGRNTPRAELVVAFARAYDRNPIEALIVAGYLNRDEVGVTIELETSLSAVSTERLLGEVSRRLSDLERAQPGPPQREWPGEWADPDAGAAPPKRRRAK